MFKQFADSLFAFFVPDAVLDGPQDEAFRARQIVFVSLTAAFFAFPFFVFRVYADGWQSILTTLLAIVIFLVAASPWVLRFTGSVLAGGLTLMLSGSSILLVYSYLDGGFYSSALLWYPLLPLFGIYFLGRRFGLAIVAVVGIDIVAMAYAHMQGWVPEPSLGEEHEVYVYATSTIGVILVLVIQSLLYVNSQREIQQELERLNRARDDFLSGMSHELRTPLNSIMGFSELLEAGYGGELNATQAGYVQRIQLGSAHLKELVDDLLNIVKIESDGFVVNPEPLKIADALRTSVEMFRLEAEESGVQLLFEHDESFSDCEVLLDESIFREVLFSLLSNAVKFTPRDGRIDVLVRLEGGVLLIDVKDTGPGIAEEHRDRVFDRFFQVHTQTHNKSPGTGLGLYIAKHLVEMMGGSLSLQPSEVGAHFTVSLPTGTRDGNDEVV